MASEENMVGNFTNNDQIMAEKILFHWFDYTLFALMMAVSVAIGVYFGFFKKQDNFVDYFLGGRNLKTFPVAMSLIASEVSGKEFIGIPSDIYTYGMTYWLTMFPLMIGGFLTYKIYLPVFYKLQLANSFEYLKMRFDNKNCLLATFLMMLAWIITMPITLYIPALTFNQVSDMNMHAVIITTSIVVTFYTAIGGLKTVVWTDALQFSIMIIAMVIVLIFGCIDTGGLAHIFQKSYDGGRIFINFDPDPANRTAFWSVLFGSTFGVMGFLVSCQISVQKFQSLPTFTNVKWAMVLFITGSILIKNMSTLTGLIIYTRYADCDPVTTKTVGNSDQLLPYYLMDVVGKIPGLPGIFTAGIFCACLSTQSTDLNTLAGLIYKEFMKPFMPKNTTEKRASDIMKILVVIVGILTTVLVYAVMHLGSIYPLIESIGGIGTGPLFAMFTLGMLVPVANSKGTFVGAVSGLLFMSWIVIGSEYHLYQGGVLTPKLPTSIEGCDFAVNTLNSTVAEETNEYTPPWIFRISFYYNCFMGFAWTMIIGIVISLSTGGKQQKVDRILFSPAIYFMLPKESNEERMARSSCY